MALYNNGYPATYPQMYQTYTPVQVQQQSQPQSSLIWVQGESGAKSYLVAPNSSVVLFDSEAQVVYLKSADATGMPSMKILDYTIRDNASNSPSMATQSAKVDYVTREEMEAVAGQIEALKKQINKLKKEAEEE